MLKELSTTSAVGQTTRTKASPSLHRPRLDLTIEAVRDANMAAWAPYRGVLWVQTKKPEIARKLLKRRGARIVSRNVGGQYLRTIEIPCADPRRWIKRHITPSDTPESMSIFGKVLHRISSGSHFDEVGG